MKISRLWAHFQSGLHLLVAVSIGMSVASSAGAQQQEFPSSIASGPFTLWKKMHANTFTVDPVSLLEQCSLSEGRVSWLQNKHCRKFVEQVSQEKCIIEMVPDGVRLDLLTGRDHGVKNSNQNQRVWARQQKATGRLDRALICDLGEGVIAYWFSGEKTSCNNIAFVYNPLPPPQEAPPPPAEVVVIPPPPVKEKECRWVPDGQTVTPGVYTNVDGVWSTCGQYIAGFTGSTQSSVQSSSRLVCE